ncbi:MAG: hypothetical protein QM756_02335 [Polyangiaceae bacterium]
MGGMLDSARFRAIAADEFQIPCEKFAQTHVVGFHNDDMFVPMSTFPAELDALLAENLIERTRRYGAVVSQLQKDAAMPHIDSGSAVLPGYAIFRTIAAYTGQAPPIEESFNVTLAAPTALAYGACLDVGVSVPVHIGGGAYEVLPPLELSNAERALLRGAEQRIASELDSVRDEMRRTADQAEKSG